MLCMLNLLGVSDISDVCFLRWLPKWPIKETIYLPTWAASIPPFWTFNYFCRSIPVFMQDLLEAVSLNMSYPYQ